MIEFYNASETGKKKLKGNKNLIFLLKKRFLWMNEYIKNKKVVIELGSGNGLIKHFLGEKIITSDLYKHKKIDFKIDMNLLILPKKISKKVDVFILNHCLHHSKNPYKVINNLKKNLKKNGFILINEPEISFTFRIFLKLFNHERWDLNINNRNKKNFWYENNATGRLLFDKLKINSTFRKDFKVIENNLSEFLIFLNSSGNTVNSPHIKLSYKILEIIDKFDNIIVSLFPSFFALNRRVVLKLKN
jgi:SAM-dependent methyltransferase